jgi:predicted metal-dependent hydrolase
MIGRTLQLAHGDGYILFQLVRRDRKTLTISVSANLIVEVVAPIDAPLERILEKIRKRAPWIRRQLRFFSQFHPRTPQRLFIAGETHLYPGRQYKLKVLRHVEQGVKLYRGRMVVQSHKPRDSHITKELVESWYRERAHVKFRERAIVCQQRFPNPKTHEPAGILIRHLQQRWGSLTAAGRLVLNCSLIKSSVDSIDYVITHELRHLRYGNHGPGFYKLLDRVMPDWEKRKTKLERLLA